VYYKKNICEFLGNPQLISMGLQLACQRDISQLLSSILVGFVTPRNGFGTVQLCL